MAKPSFSQQLDERVEVLLTRRGARSESAPPPGDTRLAALAAILPSCAVFLALNLKHA
jgi:hypothetical protein